MFKKKQKTTEQPAVLTVLLKEELRSSNTQGNGEKYKIKVCISNKINSIRV